MLIASINTEINVIYVSTVFRDNLMQTAFSAKCEVATKIEYDWEQTNDLLFRISYSFL